MLHTVYLQVDFLEFADAGVDKFCDEIETESQQKVRLAEFLRFEATVNGEAAFTEERWVDASATRKVALALDDSYPLPEQDDADDADDDDEETPARTKIARASADREDFSWVVDFDDEAAAVLDFALSRESTDDDTRVYARAKQKLTLTPYDEQRVVIPTADYKLYVSVRMPGAAEIRAAAKNIQPSRQYLDSSSYTSVVRPRPPMIRPILFSPQIGTSAATGLNNLINGKDYTAADGAQLEPDSADARLRYLIDIMNTAHAQVNGSLKSAETDANAKGHRVINIFMGPEWYFRRLGRPLTESEMINVMEGVREESKKPKWRRWLILPGSCYWGRALEWASPLKKKKLKKKLFGSQKAQKQVVHRWSVFNTIFAFSAGRMIHMYTKQYEADIDDKRRTTESWGLTDGDLHETAVYDARNQSHFEFAGIHFGLEICRDHNTCRLLREIDGKGVDVHLLSASNVDWKTERCGARDRGYFLYSDSGKAMREAHTISVSASVAARARLFKKAVRVYDEGRTVDVQIGEWQQKKAEGNPEADARIAALFEELKAAAANGKAFRTEVEPLITKTSLKPVWSEPKSELEIHDVLELKPPRN